MECLLIEVYDTEAIEMSNLTKLLETCNTTRGHW